MANDDLANVDDISESETEIIEPELDSVGITENLSKEIEETAPEHHDEPTPTEEKSKIDKLRASTPPAATIISDLNAFADKKLVTLEAKADSASGDVVKKLPEFVEAVADVREMYKLKGRLDFLPYDELKSTWLKYIHGIL